MGRFVKRLGAFIGGMKFHSGSHIVSGSLTIAEDDSIIAKFTSGRLNVGQFAFFTASSLGIGTHAPEKPLSIVTADNQPARFENTANGGDCSVNFRTSYGTDVNWAFGAKGSDNSFRIANSTDVGTTDRLVINSTGYVGFGVTSPSEMLEVNGGVKVGNSTGSNTGTIRWSGSDLEVYKTGGWRSLTGTGTLIRTRVVVATNYTASATDSIIGVTATASLGIRLPLANTLSNGHCFLIKDETGNAKTHNITIAVTAGNTLDGESSIVLNGDDAGVNVYCDGSSKYFIY